MQGAELTTTSPAPARVPWDQVRDYLRGVWKAGQHFSVMAPTGFGKSYLVTRGLLPLWRWTLILDVKGDDETLVSSGHRKVREYPTRAQLAYRELAGESVTRYRVFPGGFSRAHRPIFDQAFRKVWASSNPKGGTWTVYADETRLLADPQYLGLGRHLDALWISGRAKGITLVAGTQAPRWVPASFYDQPRYHAIGQFRDKRTLRRLAEVGGDTDMLMDVVPRLGMHEFLFLGPSWAAIAKMPKTAPPRVT